MRAVVMSFVVVFCCFAPLTPPPVPIVVSGLEAHAWLMNEHLLGHEPHLLQTLVVPSRGTESAVFVVDAAAPRVVARRAVHNIWAAVSLERHAGKLRPRRHMRMALSALPDVPIAVEHCEAPIDVVTVQRLLARWREVVRRPRQHLDAGDLGLRDGTRWNFSMHADGVHHTREARSPSASSIDGRLVVVGDALAAFACAPEAQRATALRALEQVL